VAPNVAGSSPVSHPNPSQLKTKSFLILLCSRETQIVAHLLHTGGRAPPFCFLFTPKSRGQMRLTGPNPDAPVQIEANTLSHPDDLKAGIACVELCREIGNSAALRTFTKREVMPGKRRGAELQDFIRDGASTYFHQTCTARMGRDSMSVVDAQLKVYGIENLRIADGSIMPRVTTGNTMAPCIIIGERAAKALRNEHRVETSDERPSMPL
jgi:choline dehydrogenase